MTPRTYVICCSTTSSYGSLVCTVSCCKWYVSSRYLRGVNIKNIQKYNVTSGLCALVLCVGLPV